ncbi:MAG: ABC transporter ATP-binding protein [Actinomycetota bacterium]|nr:MAG: putative ABC transport system ATP-binding [Actinomycetota bacterium]MDP3630001.1 ABC transporter ATP-binding protein [Actinomycetota bacterium]
MRDVSVQYRIGERRVDVLRDFSFAVEDGEFITITGPSGRGKTTVLNILAGFLPPTSGTVLWEDNDLYAQSDDQTARYRNSQIGMVHQFFNLIPELNAVQNVMAPGLIGGANRHEARRRAEAMLDRVGVLGRAEHLPSEMSGGEQQRVAIARALMNSPRVVLADEPTGNLDRVTAAEIVALMSRLHAEDGTTMILVTHDPTVAAAGTRMIQMD